MRVVRSRDYHGAHAWDALPLAAMRAATVRLHWTDQPYPWHVNDGDEVFAVLDGEVAMHYRERGREEGCKEGRVEEREQVVHLCAGDIFYAAEGEAHSARPCGQARILVIESAGSA